VIASLLGAVILGGGVFVLTQLLGDDKPPPAPNTTANPTAAPGAEDTGEGGGGQSAAAIADLRPRTAVAVLNGTVVTGLAAGARDDLVARGYSADRITIGDNTDQQRSTSEVLYAPDARRQARDVSRLLKIPAMKQADADTLSLAEGAQVVVITGADRAQ
jgi:hypothetical protein